MPTGTQTTEKMGGTGAVLSHELDRARAAGEASHSVILVEGTSDLRAVEALARRRGRDLDHDHITVVPIAGATNLTRFLTLLGPQGYGVPVAGLCDEGEEGRFRAALNRAGLGRAETRTQMEELGFFVCVRDLEEELIRALGVTGVEAVMEKQGHLDRFRAFQNQPAQRGRPVQRQMWRWLGNRKIRYASLMVDAADLASMPAPLESLLAHFR